MTAQKADLALVSVYSGRTCVGFVLARGKSSYESFDADERSLGLFSQQIDAAAAVMRSSADSADAEV
jgi:hypothetical protein